ncbi:MAG: hypothetical protein JW993_09880 [Sedimentisphaerales bacterium]|nr:hypothetical protein [Sedimentisphaerales bacterium]
MKKAISIIAVLVCLATIVSAQPGGAGGARGGARGGAGGARGINGDWLVSQEFNGMQMQSILSFSRDQDGGMTGQWISFMGLNDLEDVSYQDGQLTFKRTMQGFGGGEPMTQTFKGAITDGKLTGTISGDQGDSPLEGQRAPRMPRGAGIWQAKLKVEGREVPITLTIGANEQGEPTAKWTSEQGESVISDIQSSRNELSFKLTRGSGDSAREASFTGAIQGDTLSGALRAGTEEMTLEGTRMGADLIGTWNLQVVSERGTRPQRLVVNPDLSALYGAMAVKKVDFKDGQVSFKMAMEFGDRSFEMDFKGKVTDSKLEGELTTQMGSQKVTGTRVARRGRRGM